MKKKILKWLGGIPEAPNDGNFYARKGGEWVKINVFATSDEVKKCVNDAFSY